MCEYFMTGPLHGPSPPLPARRPTPSISEVPTSAIIISYSRRVYACIRYADCLPNFVASNSQISHSNLGAFKPRCENQVVPLATEATSAPLTVGTFALKSKKLQVHGYIACSAPV